MLLFYLLKQPKEAFFFGEKPRTGIWQSLYYVKVHTLYRLIYTTCKILFQFPLHEAAVFFSLFLELLVGKNYRKSKVPC